MTNSSTIIRKSLNRIALFMPQLAASIGWPRRTGKHHTGHARRENARWVGRKDPSRRGAVNCVSLIMAAAFRDLPPLILASASPRRAELLHDLGLEFGVVP